MSYLRRIKWQDAVFSVGEIVFLVGLLPTVFGDNKPSPWTSITSAIMLYAFTAVQYSYQNWLTLGLTVFTASLWVVLFIQVV